jgi:hypothetical protein
MPRKDLNDMSIRIKKVANEFGNSPLGKSPLAKQPLVATPSTILAMVMDAMIKSKPISHDISQKTMNHLIEAGYHDIDKLHKSTWEERTEVLREGGYNRYREQSATNLGNLAQFVMDKYGMLLLICWLNWSISSSFLPFKNPPDPLAERNLNSNRSLRRRRSQQPTQESSWAERKDATFDQRDQRNR